MLPTVPVAAAVLEEVVVTAQKREENLQDVPISIATISGATISEFGLTIFQDLEIPGVNISQGGIGENIFIRGIGSSSSNLGFEQSVPIFIDGAYFGRSRATRLGFLDVRQVEVLKGPQPTYFGRNAIGGAISLLSARPTDELFASLDAAYEFENEETMLTAVVSGPLSEKLRGRIAANWRDLNKGWVENGATVVGSNPGGLEDGPDPGRQDRSRHSRLRHQ